METISVSVLKAHLSAQLRRVQKGARLIVVDHKRPVAVLAPLEEEPLFAREAVQPYAYRELSPLMDADPLQKLDQDRADRW